MAPNHAYMLTDESGEPVSRTYQYRKVMKPMLERKRRARINRCLDELKELMTNALQTEGENVAKLEKADILELTVRHLHQLRRQNVLSPRSENTYAEKFKAGFRHCAAEVSSFLGGIDHGTSSKIVNHLNTCMTHIERNTAPAPAHLHQQYAANRPLPPSNGRPVQSPNAHAIIPQRVPALGVSQQFDVVRMLAANQMNMYRDGGRSQNATPESVNDSSTRINTPPLSPKDNEDASMWRPW